jgi:hypothetical protein
MAGLNIGALARGVTPAWSMGAAQRQAFSPNTKLIAEWIDHLRRPSPADLQSHASGPPLQAQVFDALANAKILTAHVAMHLGRDARDRLFAQLDSLHETEQWEPGDQPINPSSFQTFLKAILTLKPERRPGLGLSSAGNLIAAWTTGRDRLTIEFLPNDRTGWVLARYQGDTEPDRFAGQVHVSHLVEALAPYCPAHWFSHESEAAEQSTR